MLKHKHSDIGVAVALPGGLITPIVRNAESKSLSAISNEMRDLAARARARKLKPHEYQGGTTSVSNLGMYGIKDFTAVINPPQSTILAVGAGEERAVVRNGQLAVATIMSVTLSCDHRAVDGALGAELIGAFKALIENPVMMVVLDVTPDRSLCLEHGLRFRRFKNLTKALPRRPVPRRQRRPHSTVMLDVAGQRTDHSTPGTASVRAWTAGDVGFAAHQQVAGECRWRRNLVLAFICSVMPIRSICLAM